MLACRFEGMAAHAGEVVPLSPRLSCSDCSDCGVLLPCMCRRVCVCACVCNASRGHLPTRTQRRSPMMCLPSVVGEAGDNWHQSRATASRSVMVVWQFTGRHRSFLLVALLVVVLVAVLVVVAAARGRVAGARGRGWLVVVGALAGAAAVLVVRVEAGAAVAAQVLLVPVGQGLAAKGELVVLDGDDLHPGGLGGCVVVVGVLVGRGGGGGVGAPAR